MNIGDRAKGKYGQNRRISDSINKYEMEQPIDTSARRKNRMRHDIPEYGDRMEK